MDISFLKERKKSLKLTTNEVALMAELPYSTVSKIFTGETKNPSYITIELIDKALEKVELKRRIEAYLEAFSRYCIEHSDEETDMDTFEAVYRSENKLDNEPIPFAKPLESYKYDGNLAKKNDKLISVESYLEMNTDSRVQLLDGRLLFNEYPNLEHQTVVENMGNIIKTFIKANNGKCKVYSVGVNVRLDEYDDSILGPDVVVCCEGGTPTEFGIVGAPDWIIEVTSPSTRVNDYRKKLGKYIQSGVREYWVVDLQKRVVATYINELPIQTTIYSFSDEIPVFIYNGSLKIRIEDCFI